MSRIRIGWASRDISTDLPVNMCGQFFMRISQGVHDPLTVTALALENDGELAVLVSGDMIDCRSHLLDIVREEVAKRIPGFPVEKILLSATHTHTAASHVGGIGAISILPGDEFPLDGIEIANSDEYRDFLAAQITDAVCEAYEKRAEGGVSYGYGYAVVGFCRRAVYFDDLSEREGEVKDSTHGVNGHAKMYGDTADPMFSHYEGGSDAFVNLLFTFDENDKLTGAIVNVPCPSQCSEMETLMSADFWHDTRAAIREKYGDIFILPQCAAAGDLSPRQLHYKQAQQRRFRLKYGDVETKMQMRTRYLMRLDIAERIAACFDEVYAWAGKEIDREPRLGHEVRTVTLPKRIITEQEYENAKKGYAKELEAPFRYDGTPEENLYENSTVMSKRGRYMRVINRYEQQKEEKTIPMELHAVRLGDVAFASNQFEIFTDYEHRIQARSPFIQTFIVQLAAQPERNSGTYLPTERGLWGRGFGASVYDNIVTPEAGQIIVEESLKALEKLAEE